MEHRKLLEDFDRKKKQAKQKHQQKISNDGKDGKSKHPSKKQKLKDEEPLQLSAVYRDRAKERREGLNKDFEYDPDDLMLFNPLANPEAPDDGKPIDNEERRQQEIEESKYLGGDVEHTHLVKGLDFALLEKIKNDQKIEESLNNQSTSRDHIKFRDNSDSEEEEFMNDAILAATMGSKRHIVDIEKLKKGNSTEIIPCRTALARRILNVLGEKLPEKSELFLPGRMTYLLSVDISEDDSKQQPPVTTILKSKGDLTNQDQSVAETDSELALDQLINILAKVGHSGSNKQSALTSRRIKTWDDDNADQDYQY